MISSPFLAMGTKVLDVLQAVSLRVLHQNKEGQESLALDQMMRMFQKDKDKQGRVKASKAGQQMLL